MHLNKDLCITKISNFLSDNIKNSKQKNFLIIFDGKISDWLTIKLCEIARLTCGANIYYTNISGFSVDFQFAKQICFPSEEFREEVVIFSEKSECLIASSLNINSGIYWRDYNKHNVLGDLFPILDMYQSDCIDFAKYLNIPIDVFNKCEIIDAEKEYNSFDFEFCFEEDYKTSILKNDISPLRRPEWFKFTLIQKQNIAKLHQRYKTTKHKDLLSRGAPYPQIRSV